MQSCAQSRHFMLGYYAAGGRQWQAGRFGCLHSSGQISGPDGPNSTFLGSPDMFYDVPNSIWILSELNELLDLPFLTAFHGVPFDLFWFLLWLVGNGSVHLAGVLVSFDCLFAGKLGELIPQFSCWNDFGCPYGNSVEGLVFALHSWKLYCLTLDGLGHLKNWMIYASEGWIKWHVDILD
ncbi:hypothetical protein MA16_Dca014835 [Dendrobium catenatum]|uniref:Uncharacterized protein n=1 Tax=Dendrobium catenatum TaxID=906689 RepID=A0A2I0XB79_9ASPA|nr:hypothetical protein MA16_Dca014835 [Dendrobium catenatum]